MATPLPRSGDILDTAVRDALAPQVGDDGEALVAWIVVGATRRLGDGGGAVLIEVSDGGMPVWTARGIFGEALEELRRQGDDERAGR